MHVTLADVIALNGKITKGDDPDIHSWSSAEDWEHFVKLRDGHDVIVIDRNTYETAKPVPEPGKLRVVLTGQPETFAGDTIHGQLEFMNIAPSQLVEQLRSAGHNKVLVAGGGTVCSDFLAAGVVDDLYLTFEPVLFGTGKPMLAERELSITLELVDAQRLNDRGTLLAHYLVKNDAR